MASLIPRAAEPATPQPEPPAGRSASPRAIPVAMLEPSRYQPRTDLSPGSISELVDSIKESGILQPLLVRPLPEGRYQIVAGERRWRAAQAAGLHEVPALIRNLSDAEAMAAGLVENLQRTDLNAIEEAEGYHRLIGEFDMSHEALARAVGKSRSHVGNTLRLLKLPSPVLRDIQDGRLSAGHARALLLHPDPVQAARAVVERGMSVRQTEAMCAERRTPPGEDRPRVEQPPELIDVQERLSAHLGLRARVAWNGRRGRVTIDVESLDQLDGLIRLLDETGGAETRAWNERAAG